MTDLSVTDLRDRLRRLEAMTLPGDEPGVSTLTFDDDLKASSTALGVEEDGAHLLDASDLNFTGSGVTVADDGDGTATATITDTNTDTDTNTHTHQFDVTSVAAGGAYAFRLFVPANQTLTVYRGGLQDTAGAVPAGLDLQVYDETNAVQVHVFTSKYGDPDPNPTVDGGANGIDVRFELRNSTAAAIDAAGWLEYTL